MERPVRPENMDVLRASRRLNSMPSDMKHMKATIQKRYFTHLGLREKGECIWKSFPQVICLCRGDLFWCYVSYVTLCSWMVMMKEDMVKLPLLSVSYWGELVPSEGCFFSNERESVKPANCSGDFPCSLKQNEHLMGGCSFTICYLMCAACQHQLVHQNRTCTDVVCCFCGNWNLFSLERKLCVCFIMWKPFDVSDKTRDSERRQLSCWCLS